MRIMEESEQKKLIEAALFMSSDSIAIADLMKIVGPEDKDNLAKMVDEVVSEFNSRNTGLEIIRVSDAKFRMKVKDSYTGLVSHLAVDTEFSKAALRTLGLIAVKQPVKQSIVVKIIGNKAYDYIKLLAEKGFLKAKKAGNTKILEITPKFESYFGKSVDDIKKMGVS
jgi:segregation and condensation protein B